MARIPTRIYGPAQLSNAAATKYTVPASEKFILRTIHISNPSAGAIPFTLSIGADAAGVRLYDAYSIPALTPLDFNCYYVLDAAEIIQAFAGTASVLVLTLDGDRIVLG